MTDVVTLPTNQLSTPLGVQTSGNDFSLAVGTLVALAGGPEVAAEAVKVAVDGKEAILRVYENGRVTIEMAGKAVTAQAAKQALGASGFFNMVAQGAAALGKKAGGAVLGLLIEGATAPPVANGSRTSPQFIEKARAYYEEVARQNPDLEVRTTTFLGPDKPFHQLVGKKGGPQDGKVFARAGGGGFAPEILLPVPLSPAYRMPQPGPTLPVGLGPKPNQTTGSPVPIGLGFDGKPLTGGQPSFSMPSGVNASNPLNVPLTIGQTGQTGGSPVRIGDTFSDGPLTGGADPAPVAETPVPGFTPTTASQARDGLLKAQGELMNLTEKLGIDPAALDPQAEGRKLTPESAEALRVALGRYDDARTAWNEARPEGSGPEPEDLFASSARAALKGFEAATARPTGTPGAALSPASEEVLKQVAEQYGSGAAEEIARILRKQLGPLGNGPEAAREEIERRADETPGPNAYRSFLEKTAGAAPLGRTNGVPGSSDAGGTGGTNDGTNVASGAEGPQNSGVTAPGSTTPRFANAAEATRYLKQFGIMVAQERFPGTEKRLSEEAFVKLVESLAPAIEAVAEKYPGILSKIRISSWEVKPEVALAQTSNMTIAFRDPSASDGSQIRDDFLHELGHVAVHLANSLTVDLLFGRDTPVAVIDNVPGRTPGALTAEEFAARYLPGGRTDPDSFARAGFGLVDTIFGTSVDPSRLPERQEDPVLVVSKNTEPWLDAVGLTLSEYATRNQHEAAAEILVQMFSGPKLDLGTQESLPFHAGTGRTGFREPIPPSKLAELFFVLHEAESVPTDKDGRPFVLETSSIVQFLLNGGQFPGAPRPGESRAPTRAPVDWGLQPPMGNAAFVMLDASQAMQIRPDAAQIWPGLADLAKRSPDEALQLDLDSGELEGAGVSLTPIRPPNPANLSPAQADALAAGTGTTPAQVGRFMDAVGGLFGGGAAPTTGISGAASADGSEGLLSPEQVLEQIQSSFAGPVRMQLNENLTSQTGVTVALGANGEVVIHHSGKISEDLVPTLQELGRSGGAQTLSELFNFKGDPASVKQKAAQYVHVLTQLQPLETGNEPLIITYTRSDGTAGVAKAIHFGDKGNSNPLDVLAVDPIERPDEVKEVGFGHGHPIFAKPNIHLQNNANLSMEDMLGLNASARILSGRGDSEGNEQFHGMFPNLTQASIWSVEFSGAVVGQEIALNPETGRFAPAGVEVDPVFPGGLPVPNKTRVAARREIDVERPGMDVFDYGEFLDTLNEQKEPGQLSLSDYLIRELRGDAAQSPEPIGDDRAVILGVRQLRDRLPADDIWPGLPTDGEQVRVDLTTGNVTTVDGREIPSSLGTPPAPSAADAATLRQGPKTPEQQAAYLEAVKRIFSPPGVVGDDKSLSLDLGKLRKEFPQADELWPGLPAAGDPAATRVRIDLETGKLKLGDGSEITPRKAIRPPDEDERRNLAAGPGSGDPSEWLQPLVYFATVKGLFGFE